MRQVKGVLHQKSVFIVFLVVLGFAPFFFSLPAFAKAPASATLKTIAKVGEKTITLRALNDRLHASYRTEFFHGQISKERLKKFRQKIFDDLLIEKLLLNESLRRGIDIDKNWVDSTYRARVGGHSDKLSKQQVSQLKSTLGEENLIQALEHEIVSDVNVLDSEVMDFYKENPEKFTQPMQSHLSLILLAVEPWAAAETWLAAVDEAKNIKRRVHNGAVFSELAQIHSSDPSASKGGDLGYIHQGMLNQQAQVVVDGMKKGQISEPVRLLKGIAVFYLHDRKLPVLNPFKKVEARAKALLLRLKTKIAKEALIEKLKDEADIIIDEVALTKFWLEPMVKSNVD